MFCKKCGKKFNDGQKYCTNCGVAFPNARNTDKKPPVFRTTSKEPWTKGRIIKTFVIVGIVVLVIGIRVYNSIENEAVKTNNDALSAFDSGQSERAINQLREASNNAVSNENKINSLKNLGYVQVTEGQNDQALSTFQEALKLTNNNSFDYYLISAEIAVLQGKPNSAYLSFNKAYEMEPNNFQVNNSLAIFYLDLDGSAPEYADYAKALTYAQKAYNLDNSEIARQNLGIAYFFNENYNQAISLLLQSNLNSFPYISLWLGLTYAAKNDVSNAKFYLQKAINSGVTVPQEVHDYLNSY
jgi:tetratricopeptide (TPR) repeat protein